MTYSRGEVAEQNWNAEFEASLRPVAITENVIVAQSWNRDEVADSDSIVVTIDPKMSFGTGHHETTRLVTRLMENVGLRDRKILDAGTGTGILSIIAIKMGAKSAIAFDNNEWAEENARRKRRAERRSRERGGLPWRAERPGTRQFRPDPCKHANRYHYSSARRVLPAIEWS